MNLELIQSTAKTLLDAYAGLSGVPILSDDGTYPQTPDRENALADEGIVVIIWQPLGADMVDQIRSSSRHTQNVELPITVEENRVVNQAVTGTQIPAAKVVRLVLTALSGYPVATPFRPANPPWANLGNVDGVSQWIINFNVQSII